ncbi:MAG: hypothetical protein ACMUIP_01925 [bacterium]
MFTYEKREVTGLLKNSNKSSPQHTAGSYILLAKLRLKPPRLKAFSQELRDAGYWMLDAG